MKNIKRGILRTINNTVVNDIKGSALNNLGKYLETKLTHSIEINLNLNVMREVLEKFFKFNVETNTYDPIMMDHYFIPSDNYTDNPYISICKFNGTIIVLKLTSKNMIIGNHDYNSTRARFSCLNVNKDVENLRKFVKIFLNKCALRDIEKSTKYINVSSTDGYFTTFNKDRKGFEDIFIPENIKNEIKESVKSFIDKREWYEINKIPRHFGILLYGPPGTGKSSLAIAIANYIQASIYVTHNLCRFTQTFDDINTNDLKKFNKYCVNICEDIDRDLDNLLKDKNNKTSFSEILNKMDGIAAKDNMIYIFTTNNIDKVDPAIIRPGRIDLKIEIGYVDLESLNQFLKHYFGKVIDKPITIKDGLTIADLQVQVMKGSSFDEIIRYVSEDEVNHE